MPGPCRISTLAEWGAVVGPGAGIAGGRCAGSHHRLWWCCAARPSRELLAWTSPIVVRHSDHAGPKPRPVVDGVDALTKPTPMVAYVFPSRRGPVNAAVSPGCGGRW